MSGTNEVGRNSGSTKADVVDTGMGEVVAMSSMSTTQVESTEISQVDGAFSAMSMKATVEERIVMAGDDETAAVGSRKAEVTLANASAAANGGRDSEGCTGSITNISTEASLRPKSELISGGATELHSRASSTPAIAGASTGGIEDEDAKLQFSSQCTLARHEEEGKRTTPAKQPPVTTWTPMDGTKFQVRCGTNYNKNKMKAPSFPNLYETVCVRCYRSGERTTDMARTMPFPLQEAFVAEDKDEVPGIVKPGEIDNPDVPEILVVHFLFPFEQPNMFRQKDDGPGGEAVFYLRPSRRFADEVNGNSPMSPATNLFLRWCRSCDSDTEMRSRFKCMALVDDLDKLNLGWVKPYNGKPVLITDSGQAKKGIQSGVRYLEMSANVHKWAFLAKKSFVSLKPSFKTMRINVGFTIEALKDHEMPECMLGSACMNLIDVAKLPTVPSAIQVIDGKKKSSAAQKKSSRAQQKK